MSSHSSMADQNGTTESADIEPKPHSSPATSLRDQFLRDGYVVVRDAVPAETCVRAIEAFETEVKPDSGFFLRHASGRYERHEFTPAGFMKYPIMNIQDIDPSRFPAFREHGLNVLTSETLKRAVAEIFGQPGRVIHTMFFDGNQRTWAHRDSHYIDSEIIGSMVGVWVAAEDIHPGAGRFYVYAGSHRVPTPADLQPETIDPNSQTYKDMIAAWVERSGLELVAPALKQGDAILWSSLTIHGSLETTEPTRSRKSFTAHYIPESHAFIWLRRDRGSSREIMVNDIRVSCHRNQAHWLVKTEATIEEYLKARHPGLLGSMRSLRSTAAALLRHTRGLMSGMRNPG